MREKIMRALHSSDLGDNEWETEVHVVASLGMAQVSSRKQTSAGALLIRIKSGHTRYIPHMIAFLTAYVRNRAIKDKWKGITLQRAFMLAQVALEHYLNPLCKQCNGVGKIGEFGRTIVLCSRQDGGCGGTGRRHVSYTGLLERVPYLMNKLGKWEGVASALAAQKAGRVRIYWNKAA